MNIQKLIIEHMSALESHPACQEIVEKINEIINFVNTQTELINHIVGCYDSTHCDHIKRTIEEKNG